MHEVRSPALKPCEGRSVAEIARAQVKGGAHLVDVCLANPDRDEMADMRRFLQAVFWQLVIGLLIVIYVSLNPLLLQAMSFSQTFFLATVSSLAVPMLILPWSMLRSRTVSAL